MASDSFADSGDIEPVLDALQDDDCRTIITTLTEPMTADEIAETTGIPQSTTYRKLDALTEAGLLAEGVEVRKDGTHASQYMVGFDSVTIELTEEMELAVDISEQAQNADERLLQLWSEVRREI